MNQKDWFRKRVRNLGRGCLGGVVLLAVGGTAVAGVLLLS